MRESADCSIANWRKCRTKLRNFLTDNKIFIKKNIPPKKRIFLRCNPKIFIHEQKPVIFFFFNTSLISVRARVERAEY